ncbi:gamma-glutamylcyclotransferase family protein [Bosea sp. UC22_33]|uniref:gamma-glutamylcyclotransferase family protein n=1 Tax=Bosea sp. UC22_33 TaxID=3350165 RepID=UPI00366BD5C2
MPLYFAYGLNMDPVGMAERCPKARPLGPARLPRHRFIVTRDGYASVIRDPREEVHGVLWDCSLSDMRVLDKFEELASGLYVKINQPVIVPGGAKRALIYIGRSGDPGRPRPGYIGISHRRGETFRPARDLRRRLESFSDQAESRSEELGSGCERAAAARPGEGRQAKGARAEIA